MAKKSSADATKVERVVGFLGSISSILGLLLAIPAFYAGIELGKKQQEAQSGLGRYPRRMR